MNPPVLDELTRKAASQVVYQIFPERFAIGGGLTSKQKLVNSAYDVPGAAKRQWQDDPNAQPWAQQFFGGDLDGIAERLDYLVDMGITSLYLTPIFTAPSNHKYDAVDFFQIDPMFGGEVALQRLRHGLHQRGMQLTLDAVLNHVSDRHPWFLAAQAGDPQYRDWFTLLPNGQYLCWQGHGSLPELNLANPAVRDVLYRRPDSLVQSWLARGVDHWRFDVAQDVGMAVAEDVRAHVSPRFPQALLLGELSGFAGSWLANGRGFHGMMNYWYRTALLAWLRGEIDAAQVSHALHDAREHYGLAGLLCSWNMLSSHDTPRLLTQLGQRDRVLLAFLAQMTLPGVPLLYYGEENGMQGGADPDCRRPMVWDAGQWDWVLRQGVRQLIAIRQASAALQYGDIRLLGDRMAGNVLAYLRYTDRPGEAALILINSSDQPIHQRLLLPYSHWYDGMPLRDALGRLPDLTVETSSVRIVLPPGTGAIYQAWEPYRNYTFFKPRNRV